MVDGARQGAPGRTVAVLRRRLRGTIEHRPVAARVDQHQGRVARDRDDRRRLRLRARQLAPPPPREPIALPRPAERAAHCLRRMGLNPRERENFVYVAV